MDIEIGSIEERIIRILQENYPITVAELSKKMNISEEKLIFELNKLQNKGIIILEPLPDKIFIRLIRFDIRFIGRRKQYKFIKKKKIKFKEEKEEKKDDVMYS
ncbi:MAG: Lrp/AsnC family transcriptional regulator [Candidatus Thermoplasmatota archaeon]